jgi:hypothetical protein
MDVPALERVDPARSAPEPTIAVLLATLAVVVAALALHTLGDEADPRRASVFLGLFTALFGVRVAGQVVVLAAGPRWLPPMQQWNLLPYPILLPLQLVMLAGMVAVMADLARGADLLPAGGPAIGHALVAAAGCYWAAMAVRYAVRMVRRPGERWFGGAIPIVFHCVLAAWLFVLGSFHAVG